jgi:hypothetical protein
MGVLQGNLGLTYPAEPVQRLSDQRHWTVAVGAGGELLVQLSE